VTAVVTVSQVTAIAQWAKPGIQCNVAGLMPAVTPTVVAIKPDQSAQKQLKSKKTLAMNKKHVFLVYTNIQWWPPSSQWLQPASLA
jgi:hypothetical protein